MFPDYCMDITMPHSFANVSTLEKSDLLTQNFLEFLKRVLQNFLENLQEMCLP